MFSHSVAYLITLLTAAFDAKKFWISVKSKLSNFSFLMSYLGNHRLIQCNEDLYLFSFRKVIPLALMFSYLVPFESIFINSLWKGLNSFFWMWILHCPGAVCGEDYSFRIKWLWKIPCRKSIDSQVHSSEPYVYPYASITLPLLL